MRHGRSSATRARCATTAPTSPARPGSAQEFGHFVGRGGMDIEGAGWAVLSQLLQRGLVKTRGDFYRLTVEDLESLDRFARKSAENLYASIQTLAQPAARSRAQRARHPPGGRDRRRSTSPAGSTRAGPARAARLDWLARIGAFLREVAPRRPGAVRRGRGGRPDRRRESLARWFADDADGGRARRAGRRRRRARARRRRARAARGDGAAAGQDGRRDRHRSRASAARRPRRRSAPPAASRAGRCRRRPTTWSPGEDAGSKLAKAARSSASRSSTRTASGGCWPANARRTPRRRRNDDRAWPTSRARSSVVARPPLHNAAHSPRYPRHPSVRSEKEETCPCVDACPWSAAVAARRRWRALGGGGVDAAATVSAPSAAAPSSREPPSAAAPSGRCSRPDRRRPAGQDQEGWQAGGLDRPEVPAAVRADAGRRVPGLRHRRRHRDRQAARRRLEFTTPDWTAITAGGWGGRWDVSVGSMTITVDRAKVLDFSPPYYYTPGPDGREHPSGSRRSTGCGQDRVLRRGTTYDQWLNGTLDYGTGQDLGSPPAGVKTTTLPTDTRLPRPVEVPAGSTSRAG